MAPSIDISVKKRDVGAVIVIISELRKIVLIKSCDHNIVCVFLEKNPSLLPTF